MIRNKTTFQAFCILGFTFLLISCGGGSSGGLPDTDQTAPVVQSISPTNGQLDVEDTVTISLTFNEDVSKFNSSNIIIKKYIDDVNTTTLIDPILSTDGISYNSATKTLTFIPKVGMLEINSKYHILVRNIEDASGNVIADTSWDFETITKPFGNIKPAKGASAVGLSSNIQITFSEQMDLNTLMVVNPQNSAEQNPINFILTEAGIEVPNKDIIFSYDNQTNIATYSLRPTATTPNDMKPLTIYSAVLSVNAMDINANSLLSEVTSTFTTDTSGGSVTPPPLPSLDPLNVQANVGDAEVTISWQNPDPINQNGLKYNVYLSKDNKQTYLKIASNLTRLTHYQRIANNITYNIAVTSIDNNGIESIKVFANNDTSFIPLASATKISSDNFSCTIRDNGKNQNAGTLWCWGRNNSGQLGIGTKSIKESPVQVGTVGVGSTAPVQIWDDWISVSVGFGSACGIRKANGSGPGLLYCWGDNTRGNLGLGTIPTTADTSYPQQVLKPASLPSSVTVNWSKVAVGKQGHTCAIHSDATTVGELFCWGLNWYGQLGNTVGGGTAPNVMQPEPVAGLNSTVSPYNDWIEISLGTYTTCGIRQESATKTTAWCWGYGGNGQLGSTNATTSVNIPTQEQTLTTDWSSISTGNSHVCAVKAKTNSLWCWGGNFYGSLGDGKSTGNSSSAASFVAVQEATLAIDWIKVFANKNNSCGLKTNGQISCWGENNLGQTGNAIDRNGNNAPQVSITDNGWSEIAIGYEYACGLTKSNNTLCWGSAGALNLGSVRAESPKPVITRTTSGAQVLNVTAISASKHSVAGGGSHVIAIQRSLNKLLSWGNNLSFQVTGAAQNLPNYQNAVTMDSRAWKKVSSGEGYSCGILSSNDTLWCWGRIDPNNFVTPPKLTPTQIGVERWRDISITGRQSCGIKLVVDAAGNSLADDQSLWCWGRNNSNGQLGLGNNTTINTTPTAKVLSPLTTPVKWLSVSAANFNTCAITTTNDLYCWGRAFYNLFGFTRAATADILKPTTAVTVATTVNWIEVKIGDYSVCALTDTQKLYCWGSNFNGEAGTTGTQITPSLVTGGSGIWTDFDIGSSHTCGVNSSNSSLWCWGNNSDGQLGTAGFGQTLNVSKGTPEKVTIGNVTPTWNKVVTGDFYTCGIRTDIPTQANAVWCWGKNTHGELGNNQAWKLKPVLVNIP